MTSMTWMYAVAHIDDAVKSRMNELGVSPLCSAGYFFLPSAAWGIACAENIGNHLPANESGPTLNISYAYDRNRGWFLSAGPFVFTEQPSAELDLVTRMIREIAGTCEWWPASKVKWVFIDHKFPNCSWELERPGEAWARDNSDRMCEELLSNTPESTRAAFESRLAVYRNLGPYAIGFGRHGFEGYIAVCYINMNLKPDCEVIVIDSYFEDRQALILEETNIQKVLTYSLTDIRCRRVPQRAPVPPKDKCLY